MPIFDAFDSATLTRVIQKPLQSQREDKPFLGEQIAPFETVHTRVVSTRVYDVVGFGLGQFKAPDASLPLFKSKTTFKDVVLTLALLEEAEKLEYEEYLALKSPDATVQRKAGLSMVERGRVLSLRNRRLSEWMRWQAFLNGGLPITYPTGQQIYIDYGYTLAQKPTAGTLWSDVTNADPVADVQTWSELIAANCGFYGDRVHMSSKVWDYLIRSVKIKNMLNFYAQGANTIQRPRKEDILALFTSFAAEVQPVITDNGYRASGVGAAGPSASNIGWPGSITKYLPDTKVLVTAGGESYTLDGVPIADMPDGEVIVGDDPGAEPTVATGEQSEILYDHISKVWFLRCASARIVRLNIAEAFVAATIA